jgi:hypothetical protein
MLKAAVLLAAVVVGVVAWAYIYERNDPAADDDIGTTHGIGTP